MRVSAYFFPLAASLCLFLSCAGGVLPVLAYEQCQLPDSPTIGDNLGMAEAELLKTQKLVKDFIARVDGYLACSEREQAKAQALALRSSLPFSKGEQDIWNQRYNDGIDAQTRVADLFNAQVKAWRAHQADSTANQKK